VLGEVEVLDSEYNTEVARSRRGVVLDATHAFWSDYKGRILRTPKSGGPTDVVLPPSDCSLADLAVDEVGIYFGQNCPTPAVAGLARFPVEAKVAWLSKVTGERRELAHQQGVQVLQIAVANGQVHWTFSDAYTVTVLHRRGRDSPPPDPAVSLDLSVVSSNSVYLPFALASDDIVWFDAKSKELRRSPPRGGRGDLLTPAPDLESLFVVGGDAYWIARTNAMGPTERRLMRVPIHGGEPTAALPGLVTEQLSGDGVEYFGAGFNTATYEVAYRLYRWRAPDFVAEPIAAGFRSPLSIAMDEHHVFVIDSYGSERWKLRLSRIAR
jgi:hypothetical protein